MKIYLFRHGETDWNRARRLQGQSDIPLNEAGRELAVRTSQAVAQIPFDRAYTSPLSRARETARILLGDRDIALEGDERLKEMHFGEHEGADFDAAKRPGSGHPLQDFFCRPQSYVPPSGAESIQEAMARGRAFLEEKILPLEGECENILVVAHGALNRGILSAVAEIPLERFWQMGLPNCAASILSLQQGKFSILEESRVYYGEEKNARP